MTRSLIVKALRVLLVFSLVFWSTFRIEMIAFADEEGGQNSAAAEPSNENSDTGNADNEDDNPGDGSGNGDDQGGNQESGQGEGSQGGESGAGDNPDPNQGDDQGGQGGHQNGGTSGENATDVASQVVSLEIYEYEDGASATSTMPAHLGKLVYSSAKQEAGEQQGEPPRIKTVKGELRLVAVIVKDGKGVDVSTDYKAIEWSVLDRGDIASFKKAVADGATVNSNVLQAEGIEYEDADVLVKCSLKSSKIAELGLPADASKSVSFKVAVSDQRGPYVSSIDILDKDGNPLKPTDALKIALDDGGKVSYQFSARIQVMDPAVESDNPEDKRHTVSLADKATASEHDKMLLESLKWSVEAVDEKGKAVDENAASIDEDGLFKANGKMIASISCESDKGDKKGSIVPSPKIKVNTGIDEGLQGEYNPQPSITVTVEPSVAKSSDFNSAKAEEAGSSGDGDEDAVGSDGDGDETSQIEDEAASAAKKSERADGAGNQTTFTVDDLQGSRFQWSTSTYTLQGRSGSSEEAAGAAEGTTTITGAGPRVADLLEEAGADLTKIEYVVFGSYGQEPISVPWSVIAAADEGELGAILAARSYVHVEGEGDPADSDLLENTRFRLLYEDASIDRAVPWINSITAKGPQALVDVDSDLHVAIGYIPVAEGSQAVLSASVVGLYVGERFGYSWEERIDGVWPSDENPDFWTPYSSNQTLMISTTEDNIGRTFRVWVTTNNGRKAVSDSVSIVVGTGFSITLAYDPPLAGEMAFFTSAVHNLHDGESVADYIWEWTEDGGQTWQEIAGSRGNPTFSAKTDPIEPSSSGASEEPDAEDGDSGEAEKDIDKTQAPSMWVHVRAITTEGREAVSNSVMLTVHVPDGAGSGQMPTPTDQPQGDPDPLIPDEQAEPEETTPEEIPRPIQPVVQPVNSIVKESTPREAVQQAMLDGTQSTPTPEESPAEASTDLIVNPAITAEILQQQQAVNEVIESTRPGARWTALSTVEPDGQDVQRILSDNPFVPLTAPFALGITAAGFVEKLLGFRRQVR